MRARILWLLAAGCSSSTASLEPIAWQKVPGGGPLGSVIGTGNPGDFDEKANFTVTAFRDGSLVRMYFGGADTTTVPGKTCGGINPARWRIGVATSADGLTFTKIPGTLTGGSIVDNGATGAFDSYLTYRPFVLKDGATYRMWYNGSTHPFNCPTGTLALDRRIGYAESTDGVTWAKSYDGPGPSGSVLRLGAPGSADEQQVGYVWVIKDNDEYKMYYSMNDAQNFWRVGLAVSTDARNWTKVPGKLAGGEILDLGPAGSFDVACAYQPSVYKQSDQLYRMWYRGCAAAGVFGGPSLGTIGYAESNDGRTWVKIPQSDPSLATGPTGAFDSLGLTTPSVFLDGTTWNMYYAGFDPTGQYRIGVARAPFK